MTKRTKLEQAAFLLHKAIAYLDKIHGLRKEKKQGAANRLEKYVYELIRMSIKELERT